MAIHKANDCCCKSFPLCYWKLKLEDLHCWTPRWFLNVVDPTQRKSKAINMSMTNRMTFSTLTSKVCNLSTVLCWAESLLSKKAYSIWALSQKIFDLLMLTHKLDEEETNQRAAEGFDKTFCCPKPTQNVLTHFIFRDQIDNKRL